MTKTESTSDLINNLLLNLDNLQAIVENKSVDVQSNNESLEEQLESLRIETAKITSKYTHPSPSKPKSKKIPPPLIIRNSPMHTQLQTIDDMLLELNSISSQSHSGNRTPSSKSAKGRKIPNSFIDPRRFSDPYKYTILSTLNETEDGEEEEDEYNTPQTPKTALPYYSRKKDYKNITCGHNIPSISSRTRSNSQPERYNLTKKTITSSALHKSASIGYEMNTMNTNKRVTSMDYFNRIKTSNENLNKPKKVNELVVKPPRTSSMLYSLGKYNIKPVKRIEEYSNGENYYSDPSLEPVNFQYNAGEMQNAKQKNYLGLESKSSFQSDITLVNEE